MSYDECELYVVTGEFLKQTDDAIMINDGDRDAWLPKSLIELIEANYYDLEGGQVIDIEVPVWLAKEKDLI